MGHALVKNRIRIAIRSTGAIAVVIGFSLGVFAPETVDGECVAFSGLSMIVIGLMMMGLSTKIN